MAFYRKNDKNSRKNLADLFGGDAADANDAFNAFKAEAGRSAVPPGVYICDFIGGELIESSKKTPGFEMTFEAADGPHRGHLFRETLWISEAAMRWSAPRLAAMGVDDLSQLNQPLEPFRCKVFVLLKTRDSGKEYNEVDDFEVIGPVPPAEEPVAPDRGEKGEAKVAEVVAKLRATEQTAGETMKSGGVGAPKAKDDKAAKVAKSGKGPA